MDKKKRLPKAKDGRIIKRVYEKGRETTVFSSKKQTPAKKRASRPRRLAVPQEARISAQPIAAYQEQEKPVLAAAEASPRGQEFAEHKKPFVDSYDLPPDYSRTQLTLILKDPFWIYAYWDIARHSVEFLRSVVSGEQIDRAKTVLRMYDVTLKDFNGSNANSYFDIEVGNFTNNWYVSLWIDNVSYIGDIGLQIPDGRFFTLARSNFVQTPRSTYSPRTEQIWMNVEERKPITAYVTSKLKMPKALKAALPLKVSIGRKKKIVYITEENVREFYGSLSPLLRKVISSRLADLYDKKVEILDILLEGEGEEEKKIIFSQILPQRHFIRKLVLGSSLDVAVFGGGSEHIIKSGASNFVEERIRQRKFFFEIGTELIVYGRTEPDAEVYLGEKKVNLRHDGTFAMRFALPDGKIPLEFKAISGDKVETRKINTYVERDTRSGD